MVFYVKVILSPHVVSRQELRVSAEMISKQGRKFIRITVDDSGIGILPEILERIFGKHPICSIPN